MEAGKTDLNCCKYLCVFFEFGFCFVLFLRVPHTNGRCFVTDKFNLTLWYLKIKFPKV